MAISHHDPEYFMQGIDESLSLAAQQMNLIVEETVTYSGDRPEFFQHQIVQMAEVVRFLGALVATQRQEIETLKKATE